MPCGCSEQPGSSCPFCVAPCLWPLFCGQRGGIVNVVEGDNLCCCLGAHHCGGGGAVVFEGNPPCGQFGLSLRLSGVVRAVNWGLIIVGWNGIMYAVGCEAYRCGRVGFSLWLAGPSKVACWTEVRGIFILGGDSCIIWCC